MSGLTPFTILLLMVAALFSLGMLTFIAGIAILTFQAAGSQVRKVAVQTSQLAQKGLAEDVAGLVGNATGLLDSLNQLVKTTAGVGIFLALLGLIMMGAASYLAYIMYKNF